MESTPVRSMIPDAVVYLMKNFRSLTERERLALRLWHAVHVRAVPTATVVAALRDDFTRLFGADAEKIMTGLIRSEFSWNLAEPIVPRYPGTARKSGDNENDRGGTRGRSYPERRAE